MALAVPTLSTERLELRPAALADAPDVQAAFARWEVVRHLSAAAVPWPDPSDAALAYLRDKALPGMEAGTSWTWMIRLRSDPARLVGAIGLYDGAGSNRGFWLVPEHRRRGLMTEACAAVTGFWFEDLRRPVLRVTRAAENEASRRISERQGARLIGVEERDYVCGRLPAELWELTVEEWRAGCRARSLRSSCWTGDGG